jgi:hypothetical protein
VNYLIAKVWLRAAGPPTLALVFSGCGGSAIQVTPNPSPDPSPAHASAKFLNQTSRASQSTARQER